MIRATGLVKHFGPYQALDGVDLTIRTGETVALVGPNGAGKTTLLKALAGLCRADGGTVAVGDAAGDAAASAPPFSAFSTQALRAAVGFVPQRTAFPRRTEVLELLETFAALRGLDAAEAQRAATRAGLGSALDRRIGDLSGGMHQRVAIAQALLGDPPVLILDEPSTGLDPAAASAFRRLLADLRAEGKTIVVSSHLIAEVEALADRVVLLFDGKIAAELDAAADWSRRAPSGLEARYLELVAGLERTERTGRTGRTERTERAS